MVSSLVLRYARTSLRKSQEEASANLGISKDRIIEIESQSEDVELTYSFLKKLSRAYKRPLAFFLLNRVPRNLEPENDFRTLESVEVDDFDTQMALVLREAQSTRRKYLKLLNELEIDCKVDLPILDPAHDVKIQAQKLRDAIGIDFRTQLKWVNSDHRLARYKWLSAIEDKGVLILSHTFNVENIRGFALSGHGLPPAIVYNSQDDVRASIFTIIHELAHVLIMTGSSHGHKDIEKFCNAVAGNLLVPDHSLRSHPYFEKLVLSVNTMTDETTSFDYWIMRLASEYIVSKQVILRKVFDLGLIRAPFFKSKYSEYKVNYTEIVQKNETNKKRRKEAGNGGGGEKVASRVVRNFGASYVKTVLNAVNNSQISNYQAAEYFGRIKAVHIGNIAETFSHRYER